MRAVEYKVVRAMGVTWGELWEFGDKGCGYNVVRAVGITW